MKIAAVIPVHGRLSFWPITVKRLSRQINLPSPVRVVVVGWTEEERIAAERAGAHFVRHENQPLGAKWQFGIDRAIELYDPEAILIVGSTDWITDDWCACMAREIAAGADLAGQRGIYFLDVRPGNFKRMIWWGGYGPGPRSAEPIGAGRLISRGIIDRLRGKIFDPIPKSLDWSCYQHVLGAGGKVVCADTLPCRALSTSSYLWDNLHSFKREAEFPTASIVPDPDVVLSRLFPDMLEIFR